MRRILAGAAAVVLVLALAGTVGSTAAGATPSPGSAEAEFLSKLNGERAHAGLPALVRDGGRERFHVGHGGLPRLARRRRAAPAERRDGDDADAPRLLARGERRRRLLLRRRPLPRLHRRGSTAPAHRRHGVDAKRQGLLA